MVGGIEVGNDDADVGLFAGGGQQVRKGAGGNVSNGARANGASGEVFEVRGQFIQQDEDGVFAVEELEPGFFARGLDGSEN